VPQDPSPDDTPEDLPSDPSPDPSPDGGSGGTDDGELLDGSDPFEHLTLDESFVSSAAFSEPAAAERARQRAATERAETERGETERAENERAENERAARQANLQRMLSDEQTLREHQRYGQHRNAPGEWDEWDDPYADDERPRRGGRGRVVRVVAVLVVVAMVVVYAINHFVSGQPPQVTTPTSLERAQSDDPVASAGPADPRVEVVRPTNWPPASTESSPTPLGVPPAVPGDGGPHTFLRLQNDGVTPVAYDPCRPIHYVTRPGGPPEGDVLIREAIAAVSAATGLRFVDNGTTDEGPSDDRAPYQPERYGERWAPVLFSWSDPVESPRLGEVAPEAPQADPAAYAGSTAVAFEVVPAGSDRAAGLSDDAQMVFVTGGVTMDAEDLGAMLQGPDGRARVRAVIQHEIAHLVGLGHIDDQAQLMFPTITPTVTGFNDGDLEGLAALGRGACFPEL
jgi:hypothetical protein